MSAAGKIVLGDLGKIAKMAREIVDMADEIHKLEHDFLRAAGWAYTCATPGCVWLWTRKITVKRTYRGQTEKVFEYNALCNHDEAVRMTKCMVDEAIAEGRSEL